MVPYFIIPEPLQTYYPASCSYNLCMPCHGLIIPVCISHILSPVWNLLLLHNQTICDCIYYIEIQSSYSTYSLPEYKILSLYFVLAKERENNPRKLFYLYQKFRRTLSACSDTAANADLCKSNICSICDFYYTWHLSKLQPQIAIYFFHLLYPKI